MQDVVVVGAGPYGLSIAAHLAAQPLRLRAFGTPMQTWRTAMPAGMHLKSHGFASTLYDPEGRFPLSAYCREHGIPYADADLPVAGGTFTEYGLEFARRHVPMLDERSITALRAVEFGAARRPGFEVEFADGEVVQTRQVVCAVGITHYAHVAPVLADLPSHLLSHSSDNHDLSKFAGRTVMVVGGGASAADCAALLSEAGAITHLVTRGGALRFHAPPAPRSRRERMRSPLSTIGTGWKSMFYARAPHLFHAMPSQMRIDITRRHLGPAPCWFVRDQVERAVDVRTSTSVTRAFARGDQAVLELEGPDGAATLAVDHVVAATGYRVDLGRLPFLDRGLLGRVGIEHGMPKLSNRFESTVPGLYFVGPPAANAFGPLLRFACGAGFTARRITQAVA